MSIAKLLGHAAANDSNKNRSTLANAGKRPNTFDHIVVECSGAFFGGLK
jgi:hypothetical protein